MTAEPTALRRNCREFASMEKPPIHPARQRIWRAREVAHEAACRFQTLDGGELAHIGAGIAGRWMFDRNASQAELEAVVDVLRWMFLAAARLERLEGGRG